MFDDTMGWRVGVVRADADGPYIIVSRRQVATVCWLLGTHGMFHTVEGSVPDPSHGDDPIESVVRLSPSVDEVRVQEILDCAP
jgi:hypothetical protein